MTVLDPPLSTTARQEPHSNERSPKYIPTTSLGPGPATYVSKAHAVEFELQDGSLDEELPLEITITQGLAFVDCRTEGSGRCDNGFVKTEDRHGGWARCWVDFPSPTEKQCGLGGFYVEGVSRSDE